jgi:hypothetical protein
MKTLSILAAAFAIGTAIPALAGDIDAPMPNQAHAFAAQQGERIVEGRNSDRVVIETNKARAAASQGFAPVDTQYAGPNN